MLNRSSTSSSTIQNYTNRIRLTTQQYQQTAAQQIATNLQDKISLILANTETARFTILGDHDP